MNMNEIKYIILTESGTNYITESGNKLYIYINTDKIMTVQNNNLNYSIISITFV